ncbi:uncharacterized protein IL334_005811 [Kwoniella shivajii]|uniref:Ubiquitin-like protease family profile domain-containing protein n=1 Tax=Kwoniella shivajii TaxID=564305 RepID=A0ABZ1D458_9TREE|nr:hypothetical protein IL334_005811 [Kwoniella shivajii]
MSADPRYWYDISGEEAKSIDGYLNSTSSWVSPEDFDHKEHLIDNWKGGSSAISLLFDNVQTLKPREWLNDIIISFYLKLIVDDRHGSIFSLGPHFNSHIYVQEREQRIQKIKHLARSPFSFDVWLWPVHVNKIHWAAVAAYPAEHIVLIYDSSGQTIADSRRYGLELIEWASMAWTHFHPQISVKEQMSLWEIGIIETGPIQSDAVNCGIYCCQTLLELSKGIPENDQHIWKWLDAGCDNIRKVMIEELAQQKLRARR